MWNEKLSNQKFFNATTKPVITFASAQSTSKTDHQHVNLLNNFTEHFNPIRYLGIESNQPAESELSDFTHNITA